MSKAFTAALMAIATLLMAMPVSADDGLALMKVEQGARPAGMGAAFVSITDDPNGAAYNPASLVDIDKFTASFGHVAYWENVRLESGYFAMSLSPSMKLHGGIRFAVIDEIEQRMLPTLEPDNYFDSHDISFKSGLSYRISDKIAAGISIGWFFEKIDAWRGSAFNVDLGLLAQPRKNLNIGASVANLGSDFNLSATGAESSRNISLPTTYTVGASYRYQRYLGALDIVYVGDEAHAHVGAEATVHRIFALRAGYMANYDSKNVSAGASFSRRNITVDYAFVPYSNDLGTSHMFNLTFTL